MSSDSLNTNPFRVGNFYVRPSINSVFMGSETFRLEPRVMEVLCLLAEDPGNVVLREALIERLWKVEHGADESVTRAISVLRKTFRLAGDDITYIETLPKRGYRLVAPVEKLPVSGTPGPSDGKSAIPITHHGLNSSGADVGRWHNQTTYRAAVVTGALVLLAALLLTVNFDESSGLARSDDTDQQLLEQLIYHGAPMQKAEGASARVIEREQAAYRIIRDNPEIAVAIAKNGPEAGFQLLEERTRNKQGGDLQEWLNFSDFTYESHTHLALKALRMAAKIDPDHHATWMGLSELEEHQFGNIEAAMDAALNAERTANTLRDRLAGLERIAILEVESGNMASANKRFEQIVELNRQQIAAEPENPIWLQELSIALDGLGTTQMLLGDLEEARRTFTVVLALDRKRSKSDPTNWDNLRDIAISSYNLGQLEYQAGNPQLALSALEEALSINRRNLLERPDSLMIKNDVVRSLSKMSEVNLALQDAEAAIELALEAEQMTRLGLAKNPGALFLQERLLDSLKNSASAHMALGNTDEALRQFEGALEIGEELSRNGMLVARMRPGLEEVLQGLMALSDKNTYQEQRQRFTKLSYTDTN